MAKGVCGDWCGRTVAVASAQGLGWARVFCIVCCIVLRARGRLAEARLIAHELVPIFPAATMYSAVPPRGRSVGELNETPTRAATHSGQAHSGVV